MKDDPIIKEVRRSGKALEDEAHGDLHCFSICSIRFRLAISHV